MVASANVDESSRTDSENDRFVSKEQVAVKPNIWIRRRKGSLTKQKIKVLVFQSEELNQRAFELVRARPLVTRREYDGTAARRNLQRCVAARRCGQVQRKHCGGSGSISAAVVTMMMVVRHNR